MPNKQLTVEMWSDMSPPPQCSVRVKREADRLFYDASDRTFKAEAKCVQVWVPLGKSASPSTPNSVEISIDIDPKQWTDGDYMVYFHDTSQSTKSLIYMSEVTVFDGDTTTRKCPSSTEIAGRVLDATVASHKATGSVGAWMLDTTARLQKIQTKLGV